MIYAFRPEMEEEVGRGDPCWWREPDGGPKPPAEALLGGGGLETASFHTWGN